GISPFEPHREATQPLLVRQRAERAVEVLLRIETAELLLHADRTVGAFLKHVGAVLLSRNFLTLEPPSFQGTQNSRLFLGQAIDLAKVDSVVGLVLSIIRRVGAQEAVREPLREKRKEQAGPARRSPPLALAAHHQLNDYVLWRQALMVLLGTRRQV